MNDTKFRISHGTSQFSNQVMNVEIQDWLDFHAFLDNNRAPAKGTCYITAAMTPGGTRNNKNALERNWLPMDMDGKISSHMLIDLLRTLEPYAFFWYETHSSTHNAHKARFIFPLTRVCTFDEIRHLGKCIEWLVADDAYKWDRSVQTPSQPVFLAAPGREIQSRGHRWIDPDELFAIYPLPVPKPLPKPRELNADSFAPYDFFLNNGLMIKEKGDHFEVICPWCDLHSDGRLEAAYFPPSPQNNHAGGFRCLHAHCEDKGIRDIYNLIGKR